MVKKFAVLFTFIHFLRLFNFFFLKIWNILKLAFFLSLLIEMPSLKRNERVACLECGKECTRKDASRHRKHCCVLKCSNLTFYTYSIEELSNHIKKKHYSCQHNVKFCAQQPPNKLQEKIKLIYIFLKKIGEKTSNNRVQTVVKFSMEIDPKIFSLQ